VRSLDAFSLRLRNGGSRLLIALFTAQPEAPAFVLAGASGWAVND
jgi:hypothetical protein